MVHLILLKMKKGTHFLIQYMQLVWAYMLIIPDLSTERKEKKKKEKIIHDERAFFVMCIQPLKYAQNFVTFITSLYFH